MVPLEFPASCEEKKKEKEEEEEELFLSNSGKPFGRISKFEGGNRVCLPSTPNGRCMRRPLLPKKRLTARVSLSLRPSVRVTLEASSYSQRQRGEVY